jgi:hypothetical protein
MKYKFELNDEDDLIVINASINYDGVLGLDFFRDTKLTVNFQKKELTIIPLVKN